MDTTLENNTNTQNQTILAQPASLELFQPVPELKQAVPVKPDKPKPTYKCLVCGKSYSKKTSLFTHHKTHPEHCVHCGENRGSTVENIYEHNLKHVNIRPFVCKLCGDSFLRNQQFVEHEKSHLEKKPEDKDAQATAATTPKEKDNKYKCKTCQLSYTNWKLFYKHQQESGHFNEKFLCEICGSEFHSNFLLSQHIRRMHKRTDETFPCTSCSKVFATKPNLDSHIKKIHQNDNSKTHRCETCNNLFSSAPNLKQHIKVVHEVEKEYECQTCNKPFKAKNRLTRHEKEVHMGKNGNPEEVKMFNCDHCQKKYKRSWHQTRHNQMKHENSNTSTATSSTGPPTPEINGNVNIPSTNNSTYNYHQMPPQQQYHQQPMVDDMSNLTTGGQQAMTTQQNVIPVQQNVWSPQLPSQHQQHLNYGNEVMDTKNYIAPPLSSNIPPVTTPAAPTPNLINGEFAHYAVNEQYSNKFESQKFDVQATPPITHQVSYDSWNQSQQQPSWDYSQQSQHFLHHPHHHYPQPSEWSNYYDLQQQQHHAMYNNSYNNYKTEYNCLNQPQQPPLPPPVHLSADPYGSNGGNYYYPQTQIPDPYIQQHQQPPHQPSSSSSTGIEYQQHSNYHQNQNPM